MNTKRLIQPIFLMLVITSFGQTGCSHTPKQTNALSPDIGANLERPNAPHEDTRVNLGAIGVVSGRYDPKIHLTEPMNKTTGALSGAGASVLSLGKLASPVGLGGIFFLAIIPVAAVGGAIAGGLTGVPGEKVEEAKASIETAIRDLRIQETLQDQILENLQEKTPYLLVRVEGVGPVSPGERVSYHSLPGTNLDSILEIGVTGGNLEGTGFSPGSGLAYINSFLWLSMDTRVRLVRVADNTEVFNRFFTTTCYGQRLRLLEWGANDAALFRQEISNCLPSVGDRIVKDFWAPSRDLTGKWMSLYQICSVDGCEISGKFLLQNAGNLYAPASVVRFYLSEDANYDEGRDTLLKEVTTRPIEGGESQSIGLDYRLRLGQDDRRKYIITIIDRENRVAESDKANNYILGRID